MNECDRNSLTEILQKLTEFPHFSSLSIIDFYMCNVNEAKNISIEDWLNHKEHPYYRFFRIETFL